MKYMIHAVPARLWYIKYYLLPSLLQQGIPRDNITVYIDKEQDGNLTSTLKSFDSLPKTGLTCHLQDDVVIARDFLTKIEQNERINIKYPAECGFCSIYDKSNGVMVPTKDMWYSFQCIVIPNDIAHKFVSWVYEKWENNDSKYWLQISNNMFDDYLFKSFLTEKYPDDMVYQHIPNLVDHIDYLIGGSTLSKRESLMKAMYFADQDIVEALEKQLVD